MLIRDIVVESPLSADFRDGVLDLGVKLAAPGADAGSVQVGLSLFGPNGQELFNETRNVSVAPAPALTDGTLVPFHCVVKDVQAWSAEKPVLYNALISLTGADGKTEYTSTRVGFRTARVEGTNFLVNG